jgi:hypothetical protein
MITTTSTLPQNINPLSPNGYRFSIQKLPELTYFSQQVNLPGITLGEPEFVNPFASVPIPGDRLTYDALTLEFLVDEEMKNYLAVYNWLVALGFPQSYQQYLSLSNQDEINTLNELATALGNDANFATTISTSLGEKLVKSSNLSDLTSASTARTNLGLGSMAVQSAASVAITGGTIDGITLDGGTF